MALVDFTPELRYFTNAATVDKNSELLQCARIDHFRTQAEKMPVVSTQPLSDNTARLLEGTALGQTHSHSVNSKNQPNDFFQRHPAAGCSGYTVVFRSLESCCLHPS